MSQRYNHLFTTDPERFINTYSVDVKTWFEGLMRSASAESKVSGMLVHINEKKGWGYFDLEPVGGLFGWGINTVQLEMAYEGIGAYWVPYHAGLGLPGWADVKRRSPDYPFVFTAGMNGCAFVVTDSPKGAAYMRVYHNQHPNDNSIWQAINGVGQQVISIAGPDEYSGGPLGAGINPVAFNFMYYRNATWNYVFQPQSFNALNLAPPQRLPGQSVTRSVF